MTSSLSSWLASAFTALGLVLFAGTAHAAFEECVFLSDVPGAVYNTIIDNADVDFGNLSDKVCSNISKKGVSTCKAQVKTADKCFRRAFDANYEIGVKQCQQLEDSSDRAACKAELKSIRDDDRSDLEADKAEAIEECETELGVALENFCLLGPDT